MSIRCPKKCIQIFGMSLMFMLFLVICSQPVIARADALDIKLNVKNVVLVKDKSYALKVYNLSASETVSFKSSDAAIASVDETGMVTAVAIGTATINVTVKENTKTITQLQCEITVGPSAISVKLVQPTIFVMINKKSTLMTIVQPWNTTESIKFSSYDSAVATVSSGGRVTAKAIGETYVFAAIDNGKYDLCKVIVVDEDTYGKLLESQNLSSDVLGNDGDSSADAATTNVATPSVAPSISVSPSPLLSTVTPVPVIGSAN